jgi:hypothetical protein
VFWHLPHAFQRLTQSCRRLPQTCKHASTPPNRG